MSVDMPSTPSSEFRRRLPLGALVAVGVYFSYLTLRPFVVALTWAGLFAILFRDAQVALARRIGSNRAALVVTLAVTFLVIAPRGGFDFGPDARDPKSDELREGNLRDCTWQDAQHLVGRAGEESVRDAGRSNASSDGRR